MHNGVQYAHMGYQELDLGKDLDHMVMSMERKTLLQQIRNSIVGKFRAKLGLNEEDPKREGHLRDIFENPLI